MLRIVSTILQRLISLIPGVKPLPRVLQFPVTGRCNSKCTTCSVPELAPDVDMTVVRVNEIMQNRLFRKVESIGINGGEPSLVKELPEIIRELLKLPRLKAIHMITNGMLTERILEITRAMNEACNARGVTFNLSVSLDGIEEIYWACRGVSSFAKTMDTIKSIVAAPGVYCSTFSAGCTVSKYNVHYLRANEAYCKLYNIPIFYRLAVPNRRIHNLGYADDFSVLTSEDTLQAATEFFFGKVMDRQDRNWIQKFTYYAIYRYLMAGGHLRLADCYWKWRDATIDELGNLYYCATESKPLGTLDDSNARSIFFSKENLDYRRKLIEEHCNHCIHYAFAPTIKGAFSFVFFFIHLLIFPGRYRLSGRLI